MASIGRVLLIPKGDYSSSVTYNNLDWVRYNGKAWVCKVDGTVNVTPAQGDTWQLLAQDGSGGGGGASDWDDINYKPFETIETTTDFSVDGNDQLHIKRGTYGTVRVVSDSSGSPTTTDLEASGDAIITLKGGANVTLSADDSSNPKKITINSTGGGGGGSYTAGNGIDSTELANDKIQLDYGAVAQANTTKPVTGKAVDDAIPDMVANNTYESSLITKASDPTDDDYVSGYAVANWSNCDDIQLLVAVSADDDGVGTWEDDDTWETSGVRTGWIQHASLHGIMSDDDVIVEPVFKVPSGKNNAVSAYAMRVDDAITSSLGGVAIKFNAPITANGYAGIRIRHLRTNTIILTP